MRHALLVCLTLTTVALADTPFSSTDNVMLGNQLGAMATASKATLYRLEPDSIKPSFKAPKDARRFQKYVVLGEAELTPAETQETVAALADSVRGSRGVRSGAFAPQYGLRLQTARGEVKLLVSPERYQLHMERDGASREALITPEPAAHVLDGAAAAHKLPEL